MVEKLLFVHFPQFHRIPSVPFVQGNHIIEQKGRELEISPRNPLWEELHPKLLDIECYIFRKSFRRANQKWQQQKKDDAQAIGYFYSISGFFLAKSVYLIVLS